MAPTRPRPLPMHLPRPEITTTLPEIAITTTTACPALTVEQGPALVLAQVIIPGAEAANNNSATGAKGHHPSPLEWAGGDLLVPAPPA